MPCRRVEVAVGMFQTNFRKMLSARQDIRHRDIKGGWEVTSPVRTTLLTLVYTLLLIYVSICVYILLIFGATRSHTHIVLRLACETVCVCVPFQH